MHDYWVIGKIFELCGGKFKVDDLTFFGDSAEWSTRMKSGFLMHSYERSERETVKKYLERGLPTIEFGGGFGVIACTANRLLEKPADHIVVEANPHLIPILEKNKVLNNCSFRVIHGMIGGSETFFMNDNVGSSGAKRETDRAMKVPVISFKDALGKFDKVNLICDIEGSEKELFEKEFEAIVEHVSTIMIELHPRFVDVDALLDKLNRAGFKTISKDANVYVLKK